MGIEMKASQKPNCSIDGCEKPIRRNALCDMHATRKRRYGDPCYVKLRRKNDPEYNQHKRICGVEGCDRPHSCKGYCKLHYWRWSIHGDLDYKRLPPKRIARPCTVEGCTGKFAARGYCQTHYLKWKKYSDPLFVSTRIALSPQQVLEAISALAEKTVHYARYHNPNLYNSAKKHYGNWRSAVQKTGFNYWAITKLKRNFWTRQQVLTQIRKISDPLQLRAERIGKEMPDLLGAACKLFGSWKKAVQEAGIDYWRITKYKHGYWTKKRVLYAIKCKSRDLERTAKFNYDNHKDLATAAQRLFGSWAKAVKAAGFDYDIIRSSYKMQEQCLDLIDTLLGEKSVREKTFKKWLRDKGPLRIDGYYKQHQLGVEYHGRQHYEICGGHYTELSLRATQERDRIKANLLAKNGIKLLTVRFDEKLNKSHLRRRLESLEIQ